MCEIPTEKLIRAVKVRPSLYNKEDSRYRQHNKYRSKAWKEVCREVFPNWNKLNLTEKLEYDTELQKRWRNLRTCFTRELLAQKKDQMKKADSEDEVGCFRKRKKYEHFDALSFLLYPENVEEETKSNDCDEDGSEYENETNDQLYREIKIESFLDNTNNSKNSGNNSQLLQTEEENNEESDDSFFERPQESRNVEEKLLDLLKENKREGEDEDRQFMLSLVPGLKKLNTKQKYEAKIEIMKVLMNLTFQDKRHNSNNLRL